MPDLYGGHDAPSQDLAMQGGSCDMRAVQGKGENPTIVRSCSLSDVQDFSVHRSKPCSRADLKKPLHLSKVILDP